MRISTALLCITICRPLFGKPPLSTIHTMLCIYNASGGGPSLHERKPANKILLLTCIWVATTQR